MPTNVSDIVKNGCCIGCGVCEQACPSRAITMVFNTTFGVFTPKIRSDSCTNCGLCKNVCYAAFPNSVTDYSGNSKDLTQVIGKHIVCYCGFAADEDIRFKANSGGIVTAILDFLFDGKKIEGAIVAIMDAGNPPLGLSFIAKNRQEVETAMGSKYCPVLLSDALRSIEDGKTYAFIGLPCHIYAVKKLAEFNNRIKNSIKYYIGLFCGGTFSYNGLSYLLQKYGFKNQPIQRFNYRGMGWPGSMLIESGASTFTVPHLDYWISISPWFYLNTCITCISGLCNQADIACGDAWLPEIMNNDTKGTSIVVSRTKIGNHLLYEAEKNHYVTLQQINSQSIIKAQQHMLNFKHLSYNVRLNVLKFFRKKVYAKKISARETLPAKPTAYLGEIAIYIGRTLASHRKLWIFLDLYKMALKLIHL
jgi:coenzyme F420 hydrogenase subunit beta